MSTTGERASRLVIFEQLVRRIDPNARQLSSGEFGSYVNGLFTAYYLDDNLAARSTTLAITNGYRR
jgi:hypothetical protein